MGRETSFAVCIRCNAGHSHGYGHVSRCLALAGAFRRKGTSVTFILGSGEAAAMVKAHGHEALILESADQDAEFAANVSAALPDILVLDVRPPHSLCVLPEIRKHARFIALIDDISDQRLIADAVYLPPVPAVERADWNGFDGKKRIGLQWMLTGATFSPPPYRKPAFPPRLLMTTGGSDPCGHTERLAPVLADACRETGMAFGVVLGPGFRNRERQKKSVTNLPGPPVLFDVPADMSAVYGWCDAAVARMGVGAYELAHSAKPALYLCPDDDYREHARIFERAGLGEILDVPVAGGREYYRSILASFARKFLSGADLVQISRSIFHPNPAYAVVSDILESL